MSNLNPQLKEFLEQNVELLDTTDGIAELCNKCPAHLKDKLITILEDVKITIDSDKVKFLNSKIYNIKSKAGPGYTLTVRAPKNGEFNCGFTSNQGVQGGSQIAFMDIQKAQDFLADFSADEEAYISMMQPSMLDKFDWIEVPFIGGKHKFYITKQYFDKYDPVKKQQKMLQDKAYWEYTRAAQKLKDTFIDEDAAKHMLDTDFGIPSYTTLGNLIYLDVSPYADEINLHIVNTAVDASREKDLIDKINKYTTKEFIKYYSNTVENNQIGELVLRMKDNSDILNLKKSIENKYGVTI